MATVNSDKKTKDRLEAIGITVDNELAQKTKSNDAAGIGKIAYTYETGEEYKKAMEVHKLAAEKNDAYAAFQMGEFYSKGHGVRQNHLMAAEWYLRAFKLGYEDGILNVRSYMGSGKCLPEDSELEFRIINSIILTNNALTPPQREKEKESIIKRLEDIIKEEKEKRTRLNPFSLIQKDIVKKKRIRLNPFSLIRKRHSLQQPPNDTSNNKRKIEQEVQEEMNKKTKALEDKIELLEEKAKMGEENTKLLEDKIKLWEEKAKMGEENAKLLEDKIKLWEEKAKMGEDKAKLWEENASILQQSNQSLITLLEQERQIKNNQANLLNQKIEDLENMNKRIGGSGNIKLEEI